MFTSKAPQANKASPAEQPCHATHGPRQTSVNPLWAGLALRVQPKLAVGAVDDPLEREADAVADRVVQASDAAGEASALPASGDQRFSVPGAGSRMEADTLSFMQDRFGTNLSQVRIHTDGAAQRMSRELQARAFTVGNDIYFGAGRYSPDSDAGRHLLAHEVTHTLQQRQTPALQRAPIPGWSFTPADYAKLQSGGGKLTIAGDSSWFPAKLQQNLFNTLDSLLGSKAAAAPTEGVNALDTFHGHLVVKKDAATAKDAKTQVAAAGTFDKDLAKAREGAIGKMSYAGTGYKLTEAKISDYQKAIDKITPSYMKLLEDTLKIPGAAVMYHTFEFKQPIDVEARTEAYRLDTLKEAEDPSILERRRHGVRPISDDLQGSFNTLCNKPMERLKADDPRRHWVTPLDTNTPTQYTPPSPDTYEKEYTHVIRFVFLVDAQGGVHVRPMTSDTGFTTLKLSTITGKTYPEPLEFE